jgi:hypothetical protein
MSASRDRAAVVTTAILQTVVQTVLGLRPHIEAQVRDEIADTKREAIAGLPETCQPFDEG